MADSNSALRAIPSVDTLATTLRSRDLSQLELVGIARMAVDIARQRIIDGGAADAISIAEDLAEAADVRRNRRVINATGVILHTNLGRAPLSPAAADAAHMAATGYTNVELDLASGQRGARGERTRQLLMLLTGAQGALMVNNNAAALLLVLTALAKDKFVPVSRAELVEIGGSYRLPEVMAASGARLVEVGTTNKTRVDDFITATQVYDCALVLKVHQANFEMRGFTESASVEDLAQLCRSRGIPLVFDIGSGLLDSTAPWLPEDAPWLAGEPGVRQALAAGADLVTFSGDKLLGGPQAGIIVGDTGLIARLKDHPICRALRVDGASEAAMAATLDAYARGSLSREVPFWVMATIPIADLEARSQRIASASGGRVEWGESLVGAGSAPGASIESPVIRFTGRDDIFLVLLQAETPVICRREQGDLVIDLRAVDPHDDPIVEASIRKCL